MQRTGTSGPRGRVPSSAFPISEYRAIDICEGCKNCWLPELQPRHFLFLWTPGLTGFPVKVKLYCCLGMGFQIIWKMPIEYGEANPPLPPTFSFFRISKFQCMPSSYDCIRWFSWPQGEISSSFFKNLLDCLCNLFQRHNAVSESLLLVLFPNDALTDHPFHKLISCFKLSEITWEIRCDLDIVHNWFGSSETQSFEQIAEYFWVLAQKLSGFYVGFFFPTELPLLRDFTPKVSANRHKTFRK